MSVFANGNSILHKGHGQTQIATAPDVCKTPSPGGPVPIPYPNMSADSNLTDGAASVKIEGNPVANTGSKLSRSNGDEAGTAGGVVSSKNMGAFGWSAGSIDVQAEGKGVVRMLDAILTNGNTYNDAGVTLGTKYVSYGNDEPCPRMDCRLNRVLADHKIEETPAIADLCAQLVKEVEGLSNKQRGPYGRMVGVGQCKCKTYKAMSGFAVADQVASKLGAAAPPATFVPDVTIPTGDPFMQEIMTVNNTWKCAATKIISSAGGHRLLALSEKWVGNPDKKKGGRFPKFMGDASKFIFPLFGSEGGVVVNQADKIASDPRVEIPSGDSVPSCGKCQKLLPALICQTDPCG
jgi:uncharacterized Zn-binding protein involved in type VI secretion